MGVLVAVATGAWLRLGVGWGGLGRTAAGYQKARDQQSGWDYFLYMSLSQKGKPTTAAMLWAWFTMIKGVEIIIIVIMIIIVVITE